MKRTTITLVLVCLFSVQLTRAEIINAYREKLEVAELTIKNLRFLGLDELNDTEQKILSRRLKKANKLTQEIRDKYTKAQTLLDILRIVNPQLYHTANTLTDRNGNETDIYIEVADKLENKFLGYTNLNQSEENPNIYTSHYGDKTARIVVTFRSTAKALHILVHELGHAIYQVPNLASYVRFYHHKYLRRLHSSKAGHAAFDPSHQSVVSTMHHFSVLWREAKELRRLVSSSRPAYTLAALPKLTVKQKLASRD